MTTGSSPYNPLRVSVLTYSADVGAFATVARNIAAGLNAHDAKVEILHLAARGKDARLGYPPGTHMERVGKRARTCWPGVARHLRSRRPDALISLGWLLNSPAVAAVAMARTQTPLFLNEASLLSYKTRVEHRDQRGLRLADRTARWLYPLATAVTGVSSAVVVDLVEQIGLDPGRVRLEVIPNAVDGRTVVARSRLDAVGVVHPPGPVFVNVARHARQKNLPLLLRAFRRYVDGGGSGTLVQIGEGPETGALVRLATDLRLHDKVRFLGHVANPFPQMAAATALVLSSEEEGFGLVLVEAMALGVPVISTDCPGGPAEILEGGRAGLLVPTGDADAIAAAMRQVADEPSLRSRLATTGLRRAGDFSPEVIGRAWVDLITSGASETGHSNGGPK